MGNIEIVRIPRKDISNDMPFCFEDCIATIANYCGSNYELMLTIYWTIDYIENENLCGITANQNDLFIRYREELIKHHGLQITLLAEKKENRIKRIIEQLDKEKAVLIGFDTYFIPWDNLYQKEHKLHFFLIAGYSKEKEIFQCVDPYFEKKDQYISFDTLYNNDCYVYIYDKISKNISNERVSANIRTQILKTLHDEDKLKRQYHLGELFVEKPDQFQTENLDFFMVPTFNVINSYITRKYLFLFGLQYAKEQCHLNITNELFKQGYDVIARWNRIRGMFIKAFFMGGKNQTYVKMIGEEIISSTKVEEVLLKRIVEGESESAQVEVEIVDEEKMEDKYNLVSEEKTISLEHLFNNKAFDQFPSKHPNANFTQGGLYFASNESSFIGGGFYPNCDAEVDNISCMGQSIEVHMENCIGLLIYATAEYGNYSVTFEVWNDNTLEYTVSGIVYDWSSQNAKDEKCWSSLIAQKAEQKQTLIQKEHNIYVKTFWFDKSYSMDTIVLPKCPNVHLFGMKVLTSFSEEG